MNLDGLRAAKESLVRAMDFEGSANVRDAIEALGGTCDPEPDPPPAEAEAEAAPAIDPGALRIGVGFVLRDPAIEGAFAAVLYAPDLDRFLVFRGAAEETTDDAPRADP